MQAPELDRTVGVLKDEASYMNTTQHMTAVRYVVQKCVANASLLLSELELDRLWYDGLSCF